MKIGKGINKHMQTESVARFSPVSRQHLSSRPLSNSDNKTKMFPFLFCFFTLYMIFFHLLLKKYYYLYNSGCLCVIFTDYYVKLSW